MGNFQIFTKITFLAIILCNFSCSQVEQKPQIEKKTFPADVAETTETKTDVVWQNDELTVKDITQNRDLNQYEQGGHFKKGGLIKDNPCFDCAEKSVRDFIWKNWTEKKRGYIRITYHGVDAFGTSHIFVEPNENGEWRIAWRIARAHTMAEYNNLITDVPTIFNVERVENKPDKGEWALVFKNKVSNVVQTMPYFYRKDQ